MKYGAVRKFYPNASDVLSSLQSGVSLDDVGLKSDHHPIIFDITVSNVFKIPEKRLHYNFKNAYFDNINYHQLLCSKSSRKKSKSPTVDKRRSCKSIRKKKTMWKKVKKSSDPATMEKLRKFRQNIKMRVRSERKHYLKDIANDFHSNSKSVLS